MAAGKNKQIEQPVGSFAFGPYFMRLAR